MLRVEDALYFIELKGTDLDRYRARFLFNKERDDTMAALLLGAYQNSDGGYPLNLVHSQPSNISETAKVLGYAAEFQATNSVVCKRALRYLAAKQHSDGFWQEQYSQLALNEAMGGEWGKLWLTAYVGRQLLALNRHESREIKLVRNYLLSQRIQGSKFTASPAIHFLSLSFFALLDGPHCGLVKESLPFALENFTASAEPRLIALEAECLLDAGLRIEHPLLKNAKDKLKNLQGEDGAWGEDYLKLQVRTTIDVLKVLLRLKAWNIVEDA